MELKPDIIYNNYIGKKIDIDSAIDQLLVIIENSENTQIRLESIMVLSKIDVKTDKIFRFVENLLVSDNFEKIRVQAAKIIKRNYYERALSPLKFAIFHEESPECLKIIHEALLKIIDHFFKQGIRDRLLKEATNMEKREFRVGFEILLERSNVSEITNAEIKDILVNYFTFTYLERTIWRIRHEIEDCRITKLDFQFKGLNSIPEALKNLQSLKKLNLRYNQIQRIPEWIESLEELEELNINSNSISKVPSSIGNLKKLKILSLRINEIRSLPESIGLLNQLQVLNLGTNHLKEIPESMGHLEQLENLNLHGNELKVLPDSIGTLENLKKLNISWNELNSLPQSMGQLKQLTYLNLERNELKSIPTSFKMLTSLKFLNVSRNQLTSLPESFIEMDSLKEFYLGDNNFEKLPKFLKKLTQKGVQVYPISF